MIEFHLKIKGLYYYTRGDSKIEINVTVFLILSIYLLTNFKSNNINLLNDYNTYIYGIYIYIYSILWVHHILCFVLTRNQTRVFSIYVCDQNYSKYILKWLIYHQLSRKVLPYWQISNLFFILLNPLLWILWEWIDSFLVGYNLLTGWILRWWIKMLKRFN